jgi:hypothetical protein
MGSKKIKRLKKKVRKLRRRLQRAKLEVYHAVRCDHCLEDMD